MKPNYPDTFLFINGTWRAGETGATIDVINPATATVIGTVACATPADLDHAADAAAHGFDIWRKMSPLERSALMRAAAELLRARVEPIAALMTQEQGKPLEESRIEIRAAADIIDWFAEEGRRTYGQLIPARQAGVMQIAVKHPIGPVAAFTPWNFPINQAVRKIAVALAAGCSVIVKAPEETPAAPAELIRAFADAGVPAGVIGLVFGVPAQISEHLIAHRAIRKISFTGSTPVGKLLAGLAGQQMKPATMELGGHAPVLVAADADLDKAIGQMVGHKFRNAGQVCISPTRFLVEEPIFESFVERFVVATNALTVADGFNPDSNIGPLANSRRIPAIEALLQDATAQGARIVTGGKRIGNTGWFFAPTVITDAPVSARIMNEEPFGPVAIINRYQDIDSMIEEANRLDYGLASYAYARDHATIHRFVDEVQVGMMSVNHVGLALPELPFGGIRDSGYGTEGGSEAINAYLDTHFATIKS
ncbi:NAD-dependent succinate-semialdehyde dehydrogenase [Paracoccus sp. Z330]|uniref:NAD-dependent succinate-semialdehyde dehydrogenase n=1 Tax=Paracoccus onchidii TaxID=3017813 RepID=A0ABT4ZGH3_9RHOB|nr:NAD-dependent succinate-semialdehyde dehydrogenase [Paracoccus onchidii]MDB6178407.1 NAD-dependent succinate-semialdehyde dehydrogenase [Paracoccus onchidii]